MIHTKLLNLILRNGYKYPDPFAYPETVEGLDKYLKTAGIRHFSGRELATPYHPGTAKKLGWLDGTLVPPQACWPHGLACLTIAEAVRERIGNKPLLVANWYRPEPYNRAVGGAAGGDHLTATAIDIQFIGSSAEVRMYREKVVPYLEGLYRSGDYLSLGLYADHKRIHIGVYTPKGKRQWNHS